ncbi:MAG: ROK family transcriptional regulator [Candidatus Limnocylindrales bacterium]
MDQRRLEFGLRSETIRRANLSAIVRALHIDGPLSRSDLGARTGLTRSSIRVLIGELAASGLVEEGSGQLLGIPGRPSTVVRLRSERAVVLALEIAVDYLAAAIVGLGGDVRRSARIDRERTRASSEATIADLTAVARTLAPLDEGRDGDEQLVGIGVAFCGIVRRIDGVVVMAPNLGWWDVPLGKLVAEALGTSHHVLVANEADLGALAEHRRGAGALADDLLFISGEVGVGGGVIIDGRPMAGAFGYGGEVGHMPLNPSGTRCGCGSIGCWETEVGETALLALAGLPIDGGRAAVDEAASRAGAGDVHCREAFDHVGKWLGRGIATLVNVLNPRVVILGGLFARIYPLIEEQMKLEAAALSLRPSSAVVSIVPSALGVEAPLLGAAELAFERLLDDPTSVAENYVFEDWRVVA